MTKQKTLIKEDLSILRTIQIDLMGYIRKFGAVRSTFEALELGEFTEDLWKRVKNGTAEDFVTRKYWDAQDTQLKTAGITNKIIRENVLAGCQGPINAFCESLSELYQSRMTYNDPLNYLHFKDGDLRLEKGYEAKVIEEYCREYIRDEGEAEFVEAVRGIHKAYERYIVVAAKVDATTAIGKNLAFLNGLFDNDGGKWLMSPSRAVNYYRFAKKNQTMPPDRKHLL